MAIITTNSQHYTNIANSIREATGEEDEFYPFEMGEKIKEVSEASKNAAIDAMWEALQKGGTATLPNSIFTNAPWTYETFKPKYDVKFNSMYDLFFGCPPVSYIDDNFRQVSIKELEEERGITFYFPSGNQNFSRTFIGPLFKEWNVIDVSSATNMTYAFYGGYLTTGDKYTHLLPTRIERLICSESTPFINNTFQLARGYEYIGFEGTIGVSINLSWSPLCPESMKMAIMCLKNYAGTDSEGAYTIKFSDTCWAALEADSKAPDGGSWADYVITLGWMV